MIEKHETEDKIRDTPDVMDGNGHHDSASDTQTQGKDQTDENSQLADCGAATLANGLADNNELHSDKPTEEHNAGGIESSGDNSIARAQHDSAGLSDDSKTEDCGQEHKHLSQSVEGRIGVRCVSLRLLCWHCSDAVLVPCRCRVVLSPVSVVLLV